MQKLNKKGHVGNLLRSKINIGYNEFMANNTGLVQGSPLSAYIVVIYADRVIQYYKNSTILKQSPKARLM